MTFLHLSIPIICNYVSEVPLEISLVVNLKNVPCIDWMLPRLKLQLPCVYSGTVTTSFILV